MNDEGQLAEHILQSHMIPVLLWSSQFCKLIFWKHKMLSRTVTKVARVEPVPCDCSDEFSGVYGPKIRRNLEVVVDK